jgi:hypothetical protein
MKKRKTIITLNEVRYQFDLFSFMLVKALIVNYTFENITSIKIYSHLLDSCMKNQSLAY